MSDTHNIVVIMTDQQRAGLSAREGFSLDTTPFLDALASEGAWFEQAYTTYPQCVPARTSFLTGRFPSATGIQTNNPIQTSPVQYSEDLFDVLNKQGYVTGLSGKNHSYLDRSKSDHWYPLGHHGGNPRTGEQEACDAWLSDLGWGVSFDPAPFSARDTPGNRRDRMDRLPR